MAKIIKKVTEELVADTEYHRWCGGPYDTQHWSRITRYYCSNCNKVIEKDSCFCKHCGEKLSKYKDEF